MKHIEENENSNIDVWKRIHLQTRVHADMRRANFRRYIVDLNPEAHF
jgi:ribosomal protein L39E